MNIITKNGLMLITIWCQALTLTAEQASHNPSMASSPHTPSQPSATQINTTASSHDVSESFSLMLSDAEQKMSSNAMNGDKQSPDEALICHYLGAIVYSTPQNWTLWFNDQAYPNGSEIPGITILNVSHDSVNLKASGAKTKNGVLLKMKQTFCIDTGQALAGDQRR